VSRVNLSNSAAPSTPGSGVTSVYVNAAKRLSTKDDAGTVIAYASEAPSAAVTQSSPGNPAGTADLTGKMMGLAGTITPSSTGRVHITITGTIFNSGGVGDGANVQLRTGTGSAPANGDALTGTTAGGLVKYVAPTTACKVPFTVCAIVSGLSLAVARWIDVGLAAVTGGTAEVTDLSVTAFELEA